MTDLGCLTLPGNFVFTSSEEPVDWNRLKRIDVDRIISEKDVTQLSLNLDLITECKIDDTALAAADSILLCKLFRLAQLGVEYLLHCKVFLQNIVTERDALVETLKHDVNRYKCSNEILLKRVSRKIAVLSGYIEKADFKCTLCNKAFVSSNYLENHKRKRHCVENQEFKKITLSKGVNTSPEIKISKMVNTDAIEVFHIGTSPLRQKSETSAPNEKDLANWKRKLDLIKGNMAGDSKVEDSSKSASVSPRKIQGGKVYPRPTSSRHVSFLKGFATSTPTRKHHLDKEEIFRQDRHSKSTETLSSQETISPIESNFSPVTMNEEASNIKEPVVGQMLLKAHENTEKPQLPPLPSALGKILESGDGNDEKAQLKKIKVQRALEILRKDTWQSSPSGSRRSSDSEPNRHQQQLRAMDKPTYISPEKLVSEKDQQISPDPCSDLLKKPDEAINRTSSVGVDLNEVVTDKVPDFNILAKAPQDLSLHENSFGNNGSESEFDDLPRLLHSPQKAAISPREFSLPIKDGCGAPLRTSTLSKTEITNQDESTKYWTVPEMSIRSTPRSSLRLGERSQMKYFSFLLSENEPTEESLNNRKKLLESLGINDQQLPDEEKALSGKVSPRKHDEPILNSCPKSSEDLSPVEEKLESVGSYADDFESPHSHEGKIDLQHTHENVGDTFLLRNESASSTSDGSSTEEEDAREQAEEDFDERLMSYGVNPSWKGMSKEVAEKKNDLRVHRQQEAAKTRPDYWAIRQDYVERMETKVRERLPPLYSRDETS